MENNKKPQILLVNDDGIHSPGLWAAAEALAPLGYVHVVAPRDQQTSTGRSMPSSSDGIIQALSLMVHDKEWTIYAVGGTPAQVTTHGILDIIKGKPDLVVSGINYGENVASGLTISGTVGAAIEAASLGVPALAMSLQTPKEHHFSLSKAVDFSIAAYFTHYFAEKILKNAMPFDVDVVKVDVPKDATRETPWVITHQSRQRYYVPVPAERATLEEYGPMGYNIRIDYDHLEPNSDLAAMVNNQVSVTPISLDMTSRINFEDFRKLLAG